jgi:RES domain-containing protein
MSVGSALRILDQHAHRAAAVRLRLWRVDRGRDVWKVSEAAGRWCLAQDAMIYASTTAGLAMLEALAHLDPDDARKRHRIAQIDVTAPRGTVEWIDAGALPAAWKSRRRLTQAIGRHWLLSGRAAVLLVPSALVCGEYNALINPAASAWPKWVKRSRATTFRFDPRIAAP